MKGKELAAICPLFNALKEYYCIAQLHRRGVFRSYPYPTTHNEHKPLEWPITKGL